jgi:hypothetical protein
MLHTGLEHPLLYLLCGLNHVRLKKHKYENQSIQLFFIYFSGKVAKPREEKNKKSIGLLDTKVPPKIKVKTKRTIPTDEDSPLSLPAAKKLKSENNSELLKTRVRPKRSAAAKPPMSYAENQIDSDKSIELPMLPPAVSAANLGLAKTTSGKNEETNSGKSFFI